MMLTARRIVLMALSILAVTAVGVSIALPGSSGAASPATKAEAVAFARAVNLLPGDLPGAEALQPPSYEVAQDEKQGAASWSRALRCARPSMVIHVPLDHEASPLLYGGWIVASDVRVMPSEALAAAEVAAFQSRRGHRCFERLGDVQITSENAPLGHFPAAATFVPVTRLLGAGAIAVHELVRESFQGKHWFLHSDAVLFRVGAAEIAFSAVGRTQFPAATEERLLSLLHSRAEARERSVAAAEAAITRAATAPLRDALRHDAGALCGDLVPAVAANLVSGAAPTVACTAAASRDFALAAPNEPRADAGLSLSATALHLEVAGKHAAVTLGFTFVTVTEQSGVTKASIHVGGPLRLQLEEVGGVWLVSSPARLVTVPGCRLPKPQRCRRGARVVLFLIGQPEGARTGIEVPTPAAVKQAGGREQREFEAGKLVVAQSGCLACHRIGESGNSGPGPNLTHIGSKLTERQIAHALADPRQPMPSFKNLPARRFLDIVRFLALLR